LTFPANADTTFGTGNFTIEFWLFFGAAYSGSIGNDWYAFFTTGNLEERIIIYENAGQMQCHFKDSTPSLVCPIVKTPTGEYTATGAPTGGSYGPITLNTWHHFAVVRNGTTFTAYADGVGGEAQTGSGSIAAANIAPIIGNNSAASVEYDIRGHISNFRIVKGTAVYTSNFTPPTAPLENISGTVLLTCQSNRFIDNSTSGHTLTTGGNAKVSAFTPFLTSEVYDPAVNGAGVYFDVNKRVDVATGQYITFDASSSADFTLGTAPWTIEGWFYSNEKNSSGMPSYPFLFSLGGMIQLYMYGGYWIPLITYYNQATAIIDANSTPKFSHPYNQWCHWAVTRSGDNLSVFLNGVRGPTASGLGTNPFYNPSHAGTEVMLGVGNYGHIPTYAEYTWNGWLSDVRVVKGTAVYDPTASTYTVPTAPLTNISNTVLLLNMADGQAIDSAAQNTMTLYGNADTSTTQQKFGTASLYLDGSSWATMPGPTYGTGDFTWEAWVYQTSRHASTWSVIFSQDDYPTNNSISCWITHEGKASIYYEGGGTHFTTSSTFPVNTWTHLAFVRKGTGTNEFSIYINGTAGVTGTMATIFDEDDIVIGRKQSTQDYYYTGYIDEIRMSSMARYTGNFTAPTEAFPDKGQ
jgi:hypothetical protein